MVPLSDCRVEDDKDLWLLNKTGCDGFQKLCAFVFSPLVLASYGCCANVLRILSAPAAVIPTQPHQVCPLPSSPARVACGPKEAAASQ